MVGMNHLCVSIRGKTHPGERCTHPAKTGTEWCGLHGKQAKPVRWIPTPGFSHQDREKEEGEKEEVQTKPDEAVVRRIQTVWRSWLARRTGPLWGHCTESNNPYDFFSSDPVEEIPLQYFSSFVDESGKGYIMDTRSVSSLLEHSKQSGTPPQNPFNRMDFPPLYLRRLRFHGTPAVWQSLQPTSEEQKFQMDVTDLFRRIEDLGYYTNPTWITELDRTGLQRLYIELADIWNHRAMLTPEDRNRIVPPPIQAFRFPVRTALIMKEKALRPLLLDTCTALVASATARSDKQLGVIYVLGALSVIHRDVGAAYPWILEMFHPGVTRMFAGQLSVIHPSVLMY